MATRIDAWRADDGTIHATEREAVIANVDGFVNRLIREAPALSHGAIGDWLKENREAAIRVLSAYHRLHPVAAASTKEKGPAVAEKGPVVRTPELIRNDQDRREGRPTTFPEHEHKAGCAWPKAPCDCKEEN